MDLNLFWEISSLDISEATADPNMPDGHQNPFKSYQTVGIQSPYLTSTRSVGFQQSKRNVGHTLKEKLGAKRSHSTHGGCHNKYVSAGWSETLRRGNQRSCSDISIPLQISCPEGGGDSKSHLLRAPASSLRSPVIWDTSQFHTWYGA